MSQKERIDIVVPEAELERNDEKQERLKKTQAFERTDRVPVIIGPSQWVGLEARGKTAGDFVRGPVDNLREQILSKKWRIETIRDDQPIPTESLTFEPDLGCLRGVEFDMEIVWPDDQPPKCTHPLTAPEQIDSLDVPDPAGGLNAKRIEWYTAMRDAVDDFDVRLNGQPLAVNITLGQPGGPIPSAFALAGSNLFLWMMMEPERVHRLMEIVTDSFIRCTAFFDEMMGRDPKHPLGMGCDTGEMLSPELFVEFVVPYYLRVWREYEGPRGFHNCGKNEHLLDSIRDDLGINSHNGFGFCVDPELLAEKMAGRVVLSGGPDPVLVKSGPIEAIIEECVRYIRIVGTRGGYIFSTGGGIAPGTPLEHIHAMVEASRQVGCPMVA